MPKKPKRNDEIVKIDAELARKARTMASFGDEPFAEFLTKLCRPAIERAFDEFRKRLSKDQEGK